MKKIIYIVFLLVNCHTFGQDISCLANKDTYRSVFNTMKNTNSDAARLTIGKNLLSKSNCCFTISQIKSLTQLFENNFGSNRFYFLKYAYNYTIATNDYTFAELNELLANPNDQDAWISYITKSNSNCFSKNKVSETENKEADKSPPEIQIISQQFKNYDSGKGIKVIGLTGTVIDQSGISNFFINDGLVRVLSSGQFSHDVEINIYDSLIELKATDIKGNEIIKDFKIQFCTSDIDEGIPQSSLSFPNKFALIIGNEDYTTYQTGLNKENNVYFSANDATRFYEYTWKTLGIPKDNIIFLINAKFVDIEKSVAKLALKAKYLGDKAELFFYYSGHGTPDPKSNDAYLLPVDCNSSDLSHAIQLDKLYANLTFYSPKKVTCFIDACFSGVSRNGNYRSVKVNPNKNIIDGNLVVFTACTGDQLALAYPAKQHGLFTYFLLKKFQETKGNIKYQDLFNFLYENIGSTSVWINESEQTPQLISSPTLNDSWKNWNFIDN